MNPLTLRPAPDCRERALIHGTESLTDRELLALVLGTGVGGRSAVAVAGDLLSEASSLALLARLGPHWLSANPGVGPAKATRIAAALELGKRAALAASGETRLVIRDFDSVVEWARPRLLALDHEEVWMLALDGRNGLKAARRIAQGGLHGCALTPRDILAPALRDGASAILLIHNHPSGDPEPSPEDLAMTQAVAQACAIVGVPLLDHVIVARGGSSSLADRGALDR